MNRSLVFILLAFHAILLQAGIVEKTFHFGSYQVEQRGIYQTIRFANTMLFGNPGEPALPWQQVVLMLPPGEAAETIEIIEEDAMAIPGNFLLYPQQQVRPISKGSSGEFLKNEQVYRQNVNCPAIAKGHLLTQYMNGFAFALCTFTPIRYNPAQGKLTYFNKVTVKITTIADPQSREALKNLSFDAGVISRVNSFAMNAGMMQQYPQKDAPATGYQYLVISPPGFKYEFQPLISMYAGKGIIVRVATVDSIISNVAGNDPQEKIRNYIISQVPSGIQYVLLAGNPSLVPCRGLFCQVLSGGSYYTDYNIPSDLYYSALDGTFDANLNLIYGEVNDNPDLLPDIAVGRFTVNDTAELHRMIRKTVSYQTNPVWGEFNKPLLAGEHLYSSPMTFGGSFMNLLVNNHSDNGYYTHGIPSATNVVTKLYDSLTPTSTIWTWNTTMLLASINSGKSFIHHLGHANQTYMLRFSMSQITNANFYAVDGITRNYQLLYTQGCDDGAFDYPGGCIAAKAVTIDNFLVAGVFNSRYGWFDEGTTEGPSEHLEREFVSAIYNDTLPEKHLGVAHMISKIKTAPWVTNPGVIWPTEFEPGAQRWCHYDCNVYGDPALEILTGEPTSFFEVTWTGAIDSDWKKAGNWNPGIVPGSACNITISSSSPSPVITTSNTTFCHNLTITSNGNLTINPGKSIVVYGTVTLSEE